MDALMLFLERKLLRHLTLNIIEVHNVILTLKIYVYVKNLDFLGQNKNIIIFYKTPLYVNESNLMYHLLKICKKKKKKGFK